MHIVKDCSRVVDELSWSMWCFTLSPSPYVDFYGVSLTKSVSDYATSKNSDSEQ